LQTLRKEVIALQIMKSNYEQMCARTAKPGESGNEISEDVKKRVFEAFSDNLFASFESVSVANFADLSGSVFSWLEESCKPQALKQLSASILSQVKTNNTQQQAHSNNIKKQ